MPSYYYLRFQITHPFPPSPASHHGNEPTPSKLSLPHSWSDLKGTLPADPLSTLAGRSRTKASQISQNHHRSWKPPGSTVCYVPRVHYQTGQEQGSACNMPSSHRSLTPTSVTNQSEESPTPMVGFGRSGQSHVKLYLDAGGHPIQQEIL